MTGFQRCIEKKESFLYIIAYKLFGGGGGREGAV